MLLLTTVLDSVEFGNVLQN